MYNLCSVFNLSNLDGIITEDFAATINEYFAVCTQMVQGYSYVILGMYRHG